MVIKTIYIILFIFFVSCNTTNKNSTEKVNFSQETVTNIVNKKEDTLSKNDQVQKMLLSFYTEYIYTIDTISSNFSEIEQKIKQKYLTKKLILKLKNDVRYGELDWDPLINAQDASSEWLKTLKIKKVDDTHYIVHYLDKFTNKLIAINLTITKENQSYKIDDVAY